MKRTCFSVIFSAALLASCADEQPENLAQEMVAEESDEVANEFGFWEANNQGPFTTNPAHDAQDIVRSANNRIRNSAEDSETRKTPANAATSIAYTYDYGFTIAEAKISELQQRHVALCEGMAPSCRILRISQAGTGGYGGYGQLKLQIDATKAKGFGNSLAKPAEELGGEQVSFVVDGEDLSETIIDTEAKLKSRLVLRDKLTDILRNNRGSVDELVKAESAVAKVNEEIDSNRSRLENLRNRIRYSAVSIEYDTYLGQTNIGFTRPVKEAFGAIGTTLGITIGTLIYIVTALIPITALLFALRWLWRKSGLRLRRPKAAKE